MPTELRGFQQAGKISATGQAAGPATALSWSPTTSAGTYDYGTQTFSQTFTLSSAKGTVPGLTQPRTMHAPKMQMTP